MGVFAGPEVVSDGLVLSLDAGNLRGFDKYENLALNSEAISAWNNNGNAISISANSQIAPDGTLTADVLSQTAVTGASRWVSSTTRTYTAGVTYTLSIWLKKISGTDAQPSIDLWINGLPQQSVGTITTEWVRYSKSFTPASTISTNTFTGLNIGWNTNGVANNFTFAAWGFQVEVGSTATDYYPTTSTTKTRGTILTDLSGRGNTGTLTNGPTYSSSNGGSIVFDGVDDHITGTLPLIPLNSSVTIEAIIKLNDTTGTKNIFTQGQNGVSFSCGMVIVGTQLRFRNTFADYSLSSPQTLTTNQWYHLVLSTDTNETTGYVNTVSNGTTTQKITSNSVTNYFIGKRPTITQEYMNGNIAKVSVYNRAFTAAEIQQNFNALRGRFGI